MLQHIETIKISKMIRKNFSVKVALYTRAICIRLLYSADARVKYTLFYL